MSQMEKSLFKTFRKQGHPKDSKGGQGWEETNIADTLNVYDNGESRTPILIVQEIIDEL